MPRTINVPGAGPTEFPDGMSDADIQAAIKNLSPAGKSGVVDQFIGGMPVIGPLTDKFDAAREAAIAPLTGNTGNTTFGQRYNANRQMQDKARAAYAQENPKTAAAANIAGGVAGTIPAFMMAPAAATGVAGSALIGGALNAADTALRGGGGKDVAVSGGIGALTGGAAGGIGKIFRGGAKPSTAATTDQLKTATGQAYDQLRNSNVTIAPSAFSDLANTIERSIKGNLGMSTSLGPSTAPMRIPKTVAQIQALRNVGKLKQNGNYADLHEWLKNFDDIISESFGTQEAAAATVARNAIRDMMLRPSVGMAVSGDINAAAKLFGDTQSNYSAMMAAKLIEGKITQAELRSMGAHSGMNLDNTLRQRANDILLNENLRRGLPPDAVKALEAVVRGNATTDALRYAGSVMGGGGGLGFITAAGEPAIAAGVAGAGPLGMAAAGTMPLFGWGAKKLANRRTLNQMRAVSDSIRSSAPLSANQRMMKALGGNQNPSANQFGPAVVTPSVDAILNSLIPKNERGEIR